MVIDDVEAVIRPFDDNRASFVKVLDLAFLRFATQLCFSILDLSEADGWLGWAQLTRIAWYGRNRLWE